MEGEKLKALWGVAAAGSTLMERIKFSLLLGCWLIALPKVTLLIR